MKVIRCTNCHTPLPETASYCGICGENVIRLRLSEPLSPGGKQVAKSTASPANLASPADRPRSLKVPRFYALVTEESGVSKPDLPPPAPVKPIELRSLSANSPPKTPLAQYDIVWDETEIDLGHFNGNDGWNGGGNGGRNGRTWQKIVSSEFPRVSPPPVTPVRPVIPVTPGTSSTSSTFSTTGTPGTPGIPRTPVTPRPVPIVLKRRPPVVLRRRPPEHLPSFRMPPTLFFWVIVLILVGVAGGGLFGIVASLVHPALGQMVGWPTLQITPTSVAMGARLSLRGSNFSVNGKVGLTRDANIPILDTRGKSIIQANEAGFFTDTVTVNPDWRAGPHSIHAEDALLHKIASFTILITGTSTSLRPAHLALLLNNQPLTILDLGSGDQATNSTQPITLTNIGGGQISWQTTVTQPWLMVSPKSGTFSSGQNVGVAIAADRSNLKEGAYSAQVIFSSNAGQVSLPVKMKVTPLEPGHQAVLQLTPAVLSFSGSDGGADPAGQVITVSNPGVLFLNWSAAVSPGTNWLSISSQAGTVPKDGSSAVTVNVGISTLLPGTYTGFVTFTAQGSNPVKNSPQTIFVSLTITPQCVLMVSPGTLSFTGVYLQNTPAPKVISLTAPQGCSSHLHWTASTRTQWLSVGTASGVTPANLAISANTAGLTPGTHNGSVLFSSLSGTLTLPVTLIIGQPTTPILTVAPAGMTFTGVAGQNSPPGQLATITNTGGGSLFWTVIAATTVGGTWLAVTPAAGSLSSNQSVGLNVSAALLKGLIPGTYTGTITITGRDGAGSTAVGSPQTIAVTFVVQAPCAVAATPVALSFAGVAGQPNPAVQKATIAATGACSHTLNWAATISTTPAGGTWLTATRASGTVNLTTTSSTGVGVVLTGLVAGTYTGSVSITATDSVTGLTVGTPQSITVTLTVQPYCTLQTSSTATATFSAEVGTDPAAQTFTVGVTGVCKGSVTLTPTVTLGSGSGWLAVTPASAVLNSGKTVTFTVTVTSAALSVGPYTGSVSVAAVNAGIAITGSPQTVGVTLNVLAPPKLSVSPSSLIFNVTTGTSSQPVTISNTGGEPLNWTAALAAGAPAFVSLSAGSGNGVAGRASSSFNVIVDATGVPGGSTFTTSVTVGATDPIAGNVVSGSPAAVSITINITSPAMQLDTATLSFATTIGTNPASQSINITDIGGDGLNWIIGTPDLTWLTVSPGTGSDASGQVSQVIFTVDVTGMTVGTYTANVTITPTNGGTAVTVTVTVTIN